MCGTQLSEVWRNVYSLTSRERGKTHTVLSCVSAFGQAFLPILILISLNILVVHDTAARIATKQQNQKEAHDNRAKKRIFKVGDNKW